MNNSRLVLRLAWFGAAWALAGAAIAILAPSFAFVPLHDWLVWLPISVTIGLIALNSLASLAVLTRTGSALAGLPLTLAQLSLFTVLFAQIASHLGAHHFTFDSSPQLWHWPQLTAVHAFRAADIFDTLQAYGLHVQGVRPASLLASGSVVALHLVVSVFVLSLLVSGWHYLTASESSGPNAAGGWRYRQILVIGLIWSTAWAASVFYFRPWAGSDIAPWFGENILRVLDFSDIMEAWDIHWHQVPQEWWEGTLTLVFRMIVLVGVGAMLSRTLDSFRLHYLGGLGMTASELERMQADPDCDWDDCKVAGERLQAWSKVQWSIRATLTHTALIASVAGSGFVIEAAWFGPKRSASVGPLTAEALGFDPVRAEMALSAIARLGPEAVSAIEPLTGADLSTARRLSVIRTLGRLGPTAADHLAPMALHAPDAEALEAVRSLAAIGPRAAPNLIRVTHSSRKPIRERAETTLRSFGDRAVVPLMESATAFNIDDHLRWVSRLERNWVLRRTDNAHFAEFIDKHEPLDELIDKAVKNVDHFRRNEATRKIGEAGPTAEAALSHLLPLLGENKRDNDLLKWTLWRIDSGWQDRSETQALVPRLITSLTNTERNVEELVKTLDELKPAWRDRVETRRVIFQAAGMLGPSYDLMVHHAFEVLVAIGPAAKEAVPEMLRVLPGLSGWRLEKAIKSLDRIYPEWASRLQPDDLPLLLHLLDENLIEPEAIARIDPEWRSRQATKQAIRKKLTGAMPKGLFGKPVSRFGLFEIWKLDELDPHWRELPEAKAELAKLIRRLKSNDREKQLEAVVALNAFKLATSKGSSDPVEPLIEKTSPESKPMLEVEQKLAEQNAVSNSGDTIAELISRLRLPSFGGRSAVAELNAHHPGWRSSDKAVAAVDHFIGWLRTHDEPCQIGAAFGLGQLGPIASKAVPLLCQALKHPNPKLAGAAAEALGRIGKASAPALPVLRTLLTYPNEEVRTAADKAIAVVERTSER